MPQKITVIAGRGIPLVLDDIDTDRIIPARYLRCVTFDGLGEHVFEDDRRQMADHPFDQPRFAGASVLIAGRNFGCGSSREHAPQALIRWGIKAVVGESFAEIFFGNCISNGVPPVCCQRADLVALAAAIEADPTAQLEVDLARGEVRLTGRTAAGQTQTLAVPATLPAGPRQSLTTGNWDFLGQLVDAADKVRATARQLPYLAGFPQGS